MVSPFYQYYNLQTFTRMSVGLFICELGQERGIGEVGLVPSNNNF